MTFADGTKDYHDVKRPHWRCELWIGSGVCGCTIPFTPAKGKLSPDQRAALMKGGNWFEPAGREWRTCESLVKRGLMQHNGAERGKGERFRTMRHDAEVPAPAAKE